jgi:hypothetical protein
MVIPEQLAEGRYDEKQPGFAHLCLPDQVGLPFDLLLIGAHQHICGQRFFLPVAMPTNNFFPLVRRCSISRRTRVRALPRSFFFS